MSQPPTPPRCGATPLGLFIQPACLQHKYIRHANSSHIFERPERLRAVLLGVAAAVARLEEADASANVNAGGNDPSHPPGTRLITPSTTGDDLSSLLSGLSIAGSFQSPTHLSIVPPPVPPPTPGQVLLHHPAVQLAHSPPIDAPFPFLGQVTTSSGAALPSSAYLRDLFKWASEAVETIKATGCEIPSGLGLNQGDLYLGPGSILAIEGAIQTVCQAIDRVCDSLVPSRMEPSTPPPHVHADGIRVTPPMDNGYFDPASAPSKGFSKAFCAIRPPGHHCGEDLPSGFCYVNNVVVGALHAYLQHDIDRAIIIDFDLHHGNGTQALVMPLNAASHAEDLAVKAGKPQAMAGRDGKRRRGWKGFYGSVHDIYSYPCEDGDLDLIKDASINLAAHGQYIENIHLQPYASEADFYERIYPKYLALLEKAKHFMEDTGAEPGRTIVLISAGFDACEHEYQAMQRHDRRVPVSFFSRYTRDIIAFADKYTEGKVVSVLEGGYSDRALTSAAMGHVIGLLDREGEAAWWTEAELINIEKATKKKRTGKLGPFPSELSHLPHLTRAHALLAHFEGTPPDTVPSATNTPQQGSRMMLRGRRKPNGEDEAAVTPPPTASRRGRGKAAGTPTQVGARTKLAAGTSATPTPTPGAKKTATASATSPVKQALPSSASAPALAMQDAEQVKAEDAARGEVAEGLARAMAGVTLQAENRTATQDQPAGTGWQLAQTQLEQQSNLPPSDGTFSAPTSQSQESERSKVFLRFARPTPTPPSEPAEQLDTPVPTPIPAQQVHAAPPLPPQTVYPSLSALLNPSVPSQSSAQYSSDTTRQAQLAYRESSVGAASASASSTTEGEYVSATGGMSGSEAERDQREGTGETTATTATSSSEGPTMPGRFGRQ